MEHEPNNMKTYTIWFGTGEMSESAIEHNANVNEFTKKFKENPQLIFIKFWSSFKQYIKDNCRTHWLAHYDFDHITPLSLELYTRTGDARPIRRSAMAAAGDESPAGLFRSSPIPVLCMKILYNVDLVWSDIYGKNRLDFGDHWYKYKFRPFVSESFISESFVAMYMSILFEEIVTINHDDGLDEDGVPIYIHDEPVANTSIIIKNCSISQTPCVFFRCTRHPSFTAIWRNKPTKSATKSAVLMAVKSAA